jgi:hypothetical protein
LWRREAQGSDVYTAAADIAGTIHALQPKVDNLVKESLALGDMLRAAAHDVLACQRAATHYAQRLDTNVRGLEDFQKCYVQEQTHESVVICNKLQSGMKEVAKAAMGVHALSGGGEVPQDLARIEMQAAMMFPYPSIGKQGVQTSVLCNASTTSQL